MRCKAIITSGTQCLREAEPESHHCFQHNFPHNGKDLFSKVHLRKRIKAAISAGKGVQLSPEEVRALYANVHWIDYNMDLEES